MKVWTWGPRTAPESAASARGSAGRRSGEVGMGVYDGFGCKADLSDSPEDWPHAIRRTRSEQMFANPNSTKAASTDFDSGRVFGNPFATKEIGVAQCDAEREQLVTPRCW